MKGDRRRQALAAALLGAAALSAAPAATEAAPRICRQLQAELQGAPRAAAGAGQLRRYDDAVARQRDAISRVRAQSRALGCGFLLFSRDPTQCAVLDGTLSRMNGNLGSLERRRAELAGGSKGGRSRARLLALLDANGCGAGKDRRRPRQESIAAAEAGRGRLEQIFGETIARADAPDSADRQTPLAAMLMELDEPPLPRGGEYRTMCVRTCDGYFFPMSNAATVSEFERDRKNCQSSCPGTDVVVFYGQRTDEDAGRMISVATGRPYSELPNAYLYKKPDVETPQGCGCNAPRNFSILGSGAGGAPSSLQRMQSVSPSVAVVPEPKAEPAPRSDDPGRFAPPAVSPDDRKVRVVGPRFLPDPSEAIDLQAQAPTPAP